MSNKNPILTLTPDSSYADVITYDGARLKALTKEVVETSRKNFKSYDLDSDGFLDFHDVTKMMEKLGQTKTATEVRKLIAEVDKDQDGKVSFVEFLGMLAGNNGDKAQAAEEQSLMGRIYEKGLGAHAKFFESQISAQKDTTASNRDQIKKDYEEKKKIETARKAELEREKKEADEKERLKQESRNKLAAKAAMFGK